MSNQPSHKLTRQNLLDHFHQGSKRPEDRQIGIEWEKLGVYRQNAQAICYSGDRGVEKIFGELISKFGWVPTFSNNKPIALHRDGGSITLEPGGQIELSGQQARSLKENANELRAHLEEIREISTALGIAWLGIGAQPVSVAEEIEWVPKERYRIMRESLQEKGELTYRMMKETASVQVSLDYTSEKDALLKLKLSLFLSPFLIAMFANSPLEKGRFSGFMSRRAYIWSKTAPERTGMLWDLIEHGKSFEDYLDYALRVPMLFIQRRGEWIRVTGTDFKTYLEQGYQGERATEEDWELHLSGIFTESRLKNYLEIRSIDCQKNLMGLSAAAFIKGIFYHEPSLQKAWGLLSRFSQSDLADLQKNASLYGVKAKIGNVPALPICRELFRLAEEGLPAEERLYLFSLRTYLELGICPAELVLSCFDGQKGILDCAAIEG